MLEIFPEISGTHAVKVLICQIWQFTIKTEGPREMPDTLSLEGYLFDLDTIDDLGGEFYLYEYIRRSNGSH